jgi:small subunit ribosomal protein S20
MAITKNAKKAIRSHARKRVFNVRRKALVRDTLKTFKAHVANKETKEAQALLPKVYQELDKAAKRGVIKPNTASRTKSRLTAQLKVK